MSRWNVRQRKKQSSGKTEPEVKAAWIGVLGTVLVTLIGLYANRPVPAPPTAMPSATHTFTSTATDTPVPTSTLTLTNTPDEPTLTAEPGYILVDPEEVLAIAPTLRSLGQLAVEKYTEEERNSMDITLPFTVNSTSDVPILWRWFWCAATERLLEKNMEQITVLFDADGYLIPENRLAQVIFTNAGPTFEGWQCFTYETVLRDWKPGTYKFTQTMTIAAAINDGRDTFEAGYRTFAYTVNISE